MSFIQQTKYKLLTGLSVLLALNSYFFIERKSANAFPLIFDNIKIHYLIYIVCIIGLFWTWHKFLKNKPLFELIKIWLITFLPTEIVFIFGLYILHSETKTHFIFYFLTGFYLVIAALFFVEKNNNFKPAPKISIKKWLKKQGFATLLLLFLSISTFGYFGVKDLADYAGVDEPLWTFDRIPYFWKNVGEMDWKNTSISDKPGITVVEITGISLLFNNPLEYAVLENFNPQKDIRLMNLAFRLPLVIFSLLSLVFFYIFIERLLSKRIALFSTIFIGTSPILIGINRIINPDAILWVFTSLSVLAYLIFLKKETRRWLYWAGFLLGLSILTKYVANILYVFFFGLIFLEYLFQKKPLPVSQYLKKASARFLSVTFISLITFFLLFPETWVDLKKIFTGTLLSQAFVAIAPLFVLLIGFLLFDNFQNKSRLTRPLFAFFYKYRFYFKFSFIGIFSLFAIFTFLNTYLQMQWVDFEAILSSPKTSYKLNSIWSIFSVNFYPLLFTSLPIVILGLMVAVFKSFTEKKDEGMKNKIIFYFIVFILLYYFATTFNGVVSIIRYQIILYPLLFIISAIGIDALFKKWKFPFCFGLTSIILLFCGFFALLSAKPHFLGYASFLLPNKYIVDIKDMGDGSYEASQYLNSLPNAKSLFIWTDKKGVCYFFVGRCDSFYDPLSFEKSPSIDYFVISTSRKNKITTETRSKTDIPYDFEKIYNSKESQYSLFIGNRESNYVKVLKADNFKR